MKIVYCDFVGDLLHANHVRFLENAKKLGDFLIVGVITDEGVAAYKRKPIMPLEERIALTKALRCVDKVVVQKTRRVVEDAIKYKADIYVRGDDLEELEGEQELKDAGIKVIKTPYLKGVTTSKLIKKIQGEK